jgi:hypothetical protein
MATKYPNAGMLGKAKQPKINPNSPDYTGSLDIDVSLLKEMIREAQDAGEESVKINLGAWIKEGQYGKFFSIKVSTYNKQGAAPAPKLDDSDVPF